MNQEEIIQQLKKFREHQPSNEFIESSKRLILALSQNRNPGFFEFIKNPIFLTSGAITAVLVFVVSGVLLIKPARQKPDLFSLNSESLKNELRRIAASIEAQNMEDENLINESIVAAISEISNDKVNHLNKDLIEIEEQKLEPNKKTSSTSCRGRF